MKTHPITAIAQAAALAIGTTFAFGAFAQSPADLLREIQALKDRVAELEGKKPAGAPASAQWGMTPEQSAEFNRIAVKTEAMEDARDASGLKLLKIAGYMDPTFIYNKRQNRAGFQFLNAVSSDGYNFDNSYFGAAVIDFQKETDSGTKWRLTLAPNRGVGAVFDGQSIVHEASVSVPLTDLQTRFIAGQIPDWSGYEYLQPTLNKLITHNLLFDFTVPTAYTGAGMEITSGKWIVKGLISNLNSSRRTAGNKGQTFNYRVDYSRGEFQGFGFAGSHGKAHNFRADELDVVTANPVFPNAIGRDTRLDLFEVDAYFIRGDWTVQGQVGVGRQKGAAVTVDPTTGELRDSSWWGASGLVAYKFDPRIEGTARLDVVNNKKNGGGLLGYTGADGRNGIGPDTTIDCVTDPTIAACNKGANRMALTLGASWLFNLNTTFKAEYRIDRANLPVFLDVKSNTYSKTNQLFGTSVLVAF